MNLTIFLTRFKDQKCYNVYGIPEVALQAVFAPHEGRETAMFMECVLTAMAQAKYKILGDKTYYGEIPGFGGVWSNAKDLEVCRKELQEVLEGWVLLKVRQGDKLPSVHGKRLKLPAVVNA